MLGSSDNSASVWRLEEKPKMMYRTDCHRHSVTGVSVHPMGNYAVVGSKDGTWSFHNIEKGLCLKSFHVDGAKGSSKQEVHQIAFHPDGLIVGAGTGDGSVHIWDVRTQRTEESVREHKVGVLERLCVGWRAQPELFREGVLPGKCSARRQRGACAGPSQARGAVQEREAQREVSSSLQ